VYRNNLPGVQGDAWCAAVVLCVEMERRTMACLVGPEVGEEGVTIMVKPLNLIVHPA
jgi:hypothetical protein